MTSTQNITSPVDIDADLMFSDNSLTHTVANSVVDIPLLMELGKDETYFIETKGDYAFVFLISGSLKITSMGEKIVDFFHDHVYLIPMGKLFEVHAQERAKFLLFHFSPSINLCLGKCPHDLNRHFGKHNFCHTSSGRRDGRITNLQLKGAMVSWLNSVLFYLENDTKNISVYEIKLREFFYVLRLSLTTIELDEFLVSYHCRNVGFRSFVFRHHLECKTVEELSEMIGISSSSAKRMFLEEFGIPPLKWMHEQRAKYIYRDLAEQKMTLQEIADRYHFSSISYLCVFSRKMFGATPLKTRKIINNEK